MSDTRQTTDRNQRVLAMRAKERAAAQRRRVFIISSIVIAVLAVSATIAFVFHSTKQDAQQAIAGGVPAGVSSIDAGYTLPGTPAAGAPTIDLWEDFQCPACLQFEQAYGQQVTDLASSGKAKVNVHMLTFLDANLNNDSSYRSALGAAAAAEQGKFAEYHKVVYANQPKEGVGYTDAQITSFAQQAGVADMAKWTQQFQDAKFAPYVKKTTQVNMAKAGVTGTPTIFINGKKADPSSWGEGGLTAAVEAASK